MLSNVESCPVGQRQASSRAGKTSRLMVDAEDGYRIWAPSYADETPISFLENRLVAGMTPPLRGLRLLDAGCGTGRRLRDTDAEHPVGLEKSGDMLAAGIAADGPFSEAELVLGDIRAMPFPAQSFDVIWCRLVLGHLPRIDGAYAELARVADCGAKIIVSDFHHAAHDAGHRRSFRHGEQVIELDHYVYRAEQHVAAAREAGLAPVETRSAAIGSDVRRFYEEAGRGHLYAGHVGLPVVLALSFRRAG